MAIVEAEVPVAWRLCHAWEEMLEADALGVEVEYRVRKLLDRAEPIQGKAFLKTAKGQEMLRECVERTAAFRAALGRGGETPWLALTELEVLFEELLKTAYLFKVRAG